MKDSIDVPDFYFEVDDYIGCHRNQIIRVTDIVYLAREDSWEYHIHFEENNKRKTVEHIRAEKEFSKLSAPECPACSVESKFSVDKWMCVNRDCQVDKFDGKLSFFK